MSLALSPSRKRSGFVTTILAMVVMLVVMALVLTLSSVSAFASEDAPAPEPVAELDVEPLTEPDPEPVPDPEPIVDPEPEVNPDPVPDDSKKVFVCKYVGTPGVDEVLQTGDNPISVSVNAIEQNGWDGTIPGYFSDEQGRSLVIAYDTGQDPEPTCPGQDIEVTPLEPDWTDPCGPNNGYWTFTNTDGYTYSPEALRDGLGVITAFANDGYVFPEDAVFQWSETDTATPCPPGDIEVTPLEPDWTDPCGLANGFWSYSADLVGYTYDIEQTREDGLSVINAIAADGYVFPKDAQVQWSETDSGELCPPDVEVTPLVPDWMDPCGLDNGYWVYTNADGYTYDVEETREDGLSVITAFANDGYVFPEDAVFQWSDSDSGELCPPKPPILASTGADDQGMNSLLASALTMLALGGLALGLRRKLTV